MSEEKAKTTFQKILDLVDGLGDFVLDDVVHDLVRQDASRINNGGYDEQIDFIISRLGEEEALRYATDAAKERAQLGENNAK